jgi:hypothetical protein
MRPPAPRKFTILDGMILVAAIACGLAMSRAMGVWYGNGALYEQNWFGRITDDPVKVGAAIPFVLTLTAGVLLIRLRRPRPRWRRLARQPGMAACAAAVVPIAIMLLQICRLEWCSDHVGYGDMYARWVSWKVLLWDCGFHAGLWVLAAWLALALSGRRRSEPSEIDRLGRLVGAGWLMILAVRILGTA